MVYTSTNTKDRIDQQDLEKRNRPWLVQMTEAFSKYNLIFEFPAILILSLGQLLKLFYTYI